jgi:hypothetical protein
MVSETEKQVLTSSRRQDEVFQKIANPSIRLRPSALRLRLEETGRRFFDRKRDII